MKKKMVDDAISSLQRGPVRYECNSSSGWRDQFLVFNREHPSGVFVSFEELSQIMDENEGFCLDHVYAGAQLWLIPRGDHQRFPGQLLNFALSRNIQATLTGYVELGLPPEPLAN